MERERQREREREREKEREREREDIAKRRPSQWRSCRRERPDGTLPRFIQREREREDKLLTRGSSPGGVTGILG